MGPGTAGQGKTRAIRRREGRGGPMMGVKRSAKERPRNRRIVPFVCRGVSLEGPFVYSLNGGGIRGPLRGPHDGGPWASRALFGTKYARCAQLWPLNYLVRVSLFIEYRACLFLRRACVPRCKRKNTGVLKGRRVGRTARGGGFSLFLSFTFSPLLPFFFFP